MPKLLTPTRIARARRRRGLDKKELGRLLGATARTINTYERLGAPLRMQRDLARELNHDPSYFTLPACENPFFDLNFRNRTAGSHAKNAAMVALADALDILALDHPQLLPSPTPPAPPRNADPAVIARELRARWGLAGAPAGDLVELCRLHHTTVCGLPADARDVLSFSVRTAALAPDVDTSAIIFVRTDLTPEAQRWSISFELGHLALGQATARRHSDLQVRRAETFAGEFLLPTPALLNHLVTPPRGSRGRPGTTDIAYRPRGFARKEADTVTSLLRTCAGYGVAPDTAIKIMHARGLIDRKVRERLSAKLPVILAAGSTPEGVDTTGWDLVGTDDGDGHRLRATFTGSRGDDSDPDSPTVDTHVDPGEDEDDYPDTRRREWLIECDGEPPTPEPVLHPSSTRSTVAEIVSELTLPMDCVLSIHELARDTEEGPIALELPKRFLPRTRKITR